MAASTSAEPLPLNEKEMEKCVNELENVQCEEELEKKLNTMSKLGFSIANWMKILFNRDTSREEFKAVWLTIDEYKIQAEEGMQTAWRILNLPNWKLEKRGIQRGDVVESVHTEHFGKVYRFTGVVDCPSKFLYCEFRDNVAKLPEWNPTILKSEIIKEIGPGVDLSYQMTAGGGGGIIAPRDFINLRKTVKLSRDGQVVDTEDPYCYISSGVSVQVPGYPPRKDLVRGHNKVGCWFMKPNRTQTSAGKIEERCIFQWLMCCDLKGKIPHFVLDKAFATVMLEYIVHVRKYAAQAKARGMF